MSENIFDLSQFASEYVEPHCVPAGEEYELRIIEAKVGTAKSSGMPYIRCRCEIIGDDAANDISMFVSMPHADREPKSNNRLLKRLNDFCDAFELPSPLKNPKFNPEEDWQGATGWAILGVETSEEFGDQNTVKKVVARK